MAKGEWSSWVIDAPKEVPVPDHPGKKLHAEKERFRETVEKLLAEKPPESGPEELLAHRIANAAHVRMLSGSYIGSEAMRDGIAGWMEASSLRWGRCAVEARTAGHHEVAERLLATAVRDRMLADLIRSIDPKEPMSVPESGGKDIVASLLRYAVQIKSEAEESPGAEKAEK